MKEYFYELAEKIDSFRTGHEILLFSFQGEDSEFCRFNQAKIRQNGRVIHNRMEIRMVDNLRHASLEFTLSGQINEDIGRAKRVLESLRTILVNLKADPYFICNDRIQSSDSTQISSLPSTEEWQETILSEAGGLDLVGFWASGGIFKGFANSYGQRNWFETHSFNFDWSLYHQDDKAVKSNYAGFSWSRDQLQVKMENARQQLSFLKLPQKALKPGSYRAYLSPAALSEIFGLLGWRGFGVKSQKTKSSPLIKLQEGQLQLNRELSITEDVAGGVAPNFDSFGFTKPKQISLVDEGKHSGSLVSARSSREFSIETTGCSDSEQPESLSIGAGSIKEAEILSKLGDGLYINNLWYTNFSDTSSCRMTGMTRFACFWVEQGVIKNPLNVMRFDDTFFRMFGENLIGLTENRELHLSSSTYEGRSTQSALLPGALLRGLDLTL